MADQPSPPVGSVIETALYVADLERSISFYGLVLGLEPASEPIEWSRSCHVSSPPQQRVRLKLTPRKPERFMRRLLRAVDERA